MSSYLKNNQKKSSLQIIFSIRSRTLNKKEFQPWNYEDNLCGQCKIFAETMEHFCKCGAYNSETENTWTDIFISTENKCQLPACLLLEILVINSVPYHKTKVQLQTILGWS